MPSTIESAVTPPPFEIGHPADSACRQSCEQPPVQALDSKFGFEIQNSPLTGGSTAAAPFNLSPFNPLPLTLKSPLTSPLPLPLTLTLPLKPPSPGFVLLEAVIALAIISLFSLALLSAVGAQVRTAAKADVLLTARPLAEDRVTAIRLLDHAQLLRLPDSLRAGTFPPPFEAYGWTAAVEPAGNEFDLFAVEVVVEAYGEAFPLSTMVHRPQPQLEAGAAGGAAGGGTGVAPLPPPPVPGGGP
jgi:type II secretory pathway pseudopilin PulG